jgi:YVTN family beta-propeller protein
MPLVGPFILAKNKSSLLVIDTSTNSVIDRIVRDSYPSNPCITPDGRLLYAVSGNKVLTIEVSTNKIVREISLGEAGGFFYDIAIVSGHDKAYVTNVRSRHIYVVDLRAGTVIKKVDVGWWPQMVVVTPDGSRAYVSRQNNPYDTGGIVVIDTATDQIIETIDPPTGTSGTIGRFDLLVAARNGAYIYWATDGPGVNVIEVATNKVVKTIDLRMQVVDREWGSPRGIHPTDISFTSDGSRGYIPCGDAYYVAVVDIATGTVIDRIMDVGIEPVAIVITPDDRFAYVTNKEGENVSVIDLAANKVIASISTRN